MQGSRTGEASIFCSSGNIQRTGKGDKKLMKRSSSQKLKFFTPVPESQLPNFPKKRKDCIGPCRLCVLSVQAPLHRGFPKSKKRSKPLTFIFQTPQTERKPQSVIIFLLYIQDLVYYNLRQRVKRVPICCFGARTVQYRFFGGCIL